MKLYIAIAAWERARTTPCIYTMIQNEEKEIKVYRTMILPGGKKETAEHIDYQELLTADFLPVYYESDYRTALAYVSGEHRLLFLNSRRRVWYNIYRKPLRRS